MSSTSVFIGGLSIGVVGTLVFQNAASAPQPEPLFGGPWEFVVPALLLVVVAYMVIQAIHIMPRMR